MKERKIIILAHSRSGSSTLHKILNMCEGVNLIAEPFHENRAEFDSSTSSHKESPKSKQDLDMALSSIFEEYTGFKTLTYQLSSELYGHLFESLAPDDSVILLHRQDVFHTALSTHIAEQIDGWRMTNSDIVKELSQAQIEPLEPARLFELIDFFKRSATFFKPRITEKHKPPLVITYEELFSHDNDTRQKTLGNILAFCSLSPQEESIKEMHQLLSPKNKQNDPTTYSLIPNYTELLETYAKSTQ